MIITEGDEEESEGRTGCVSCVHIIWEAVGGGKSFDERETNVYAHY